MEKSQPLLTNYDQPSSWDLSATLTYQKMTLSCEVLNCTERYWTVLFLPSIPKRTVCRNCPTITIVCNENSPRETSCSYDRGYLKCCSMHFVHVNCQATQYKWLLVVLNWNTPWSWNNISKSVQTDQAFLNNTTANYKDKLFKIRPIIEKLNERLRKVPIEESLAVDKQIIQFKGRHSIKQYNPKKLRKWVFKVFILSGMSGFSYNLALQWQRK